MRTKIGQSNREEKQFVQDRDAHQKEIIFLAFFSPTFFFTFNHRQADCSALTKKIVEKTYNDNLESYILHQRLEISQLSSTYHILSILPV